MGFFFRARRKEDDRNASRFLVGTEMLQDFKPIESRHHDVAQDKIRWMLARTRNHGPAVCYRFDLVLLGEKARKVLTHICVIVSNQDASAIFLRGSWMRYCD